MAEDKSTHNLVPGWWLKLPPNVRGALWVTFGSVCFALSDVIVKSLGKEFHPVELAFFRYSVGLLILMPVFVRMGWSGLATKKIHLHILRLILATTAQLGVFLSVIHLYLADATALGFSRPLFTTIIAVIVLSEIVTWRRWMATLIGFAGVLIMVRPGSGELDPIAIIAIISALIFAASNIVIRIMAPTEPPNRILFYYQLGGAILFAGPAWWFWVQPAGVEWLLMFLIGVLTTLGIMGFVRAFSIGQANAIGPIEYSRLIFAALFGYFLFSEIPSIWTGIGAVIIIAATIYITREEMQAGRRQGPQA